MCEYIENFLIGLVSGIVSSAIVTVVFSFKEKKRKRKQGFNDDVQTFHRWILRIRNELEIAYKYGDVTFLKRTIEDEPIFNYFDDLTDESVKVKTEITEFVKNLVDIYSSTQIDEKHFKSDSGLLFKYSVDSLKFNKDKVLR